VSNGVFAGLFTRSGSDFGAFQGVGPVRWFLSLRPVGAAPQAFRPQSGALSQADVLLPGLKPWPRPIPAGLYRRFLARQDV
jgi:hypothetical protein